MVIEIKPLKLKGEQIEPVFTPEEYPKPKPLPLPTVKEVTPFTVENTTENIIFPETEIKSQITPIIGWKATLNEFPGALLQTLKDTIGLSEKNVQNLIEDNPAWNKLSITQQLGSFWGEYGKGIAKFIWSIPQAAIQFIATPTIGAVEEIYKTSLGEIKFPTKVGDWIGPLTGTRTQREIYLNQGYTETEAIGLVTAGQLARALPFVTVFGMPAYIEALIRRPTVEQTYQLTFEMKESTMAQKAPLDKMLYGGRSEMGYRQWVAGVQGQPNKFIVVSENPYSPTGKMMHGFEVTDPGLAIQNKVFVGNKVIPAPEGLSFPQQNLAAPGLVHWISFSPVKAHTLFLEEAIYRAMPTITKRVPTPLPKTAPPISLEPLIPKPEIKPTPVTPEVPVTPIKELPKITSIEAREIGRNIVPIDVIKFNEKTIEAKLVTELTKKGINPSQAKLFAEQFSGDIVLAAESAQGIEAKTEAIINAAQEKITGLKITPEKVTFEKQVTEPEIPKKIEVKRLEEVKPEIPKELEPIIQEGRKSNAVARLKHDEALERIKKGDFEGAKWVADSIYDQIDLQPKYKAAFYKDIENRIIQAVKGVKEVKPVIPKELQGWQKVFRATDTPYEPSKITPKLGISVGKTLEDAEYFARKGGQLEILYLDKNAKILEKIPSQFLKKPKGWEPEDYLTIDEDALIAYVRKNGYDAYHLDPTINSGIDEIKIINPDVLKSESQIIKGVEKVKPEVLYHGTTIEVREKVLTEGLKPVEGKIFLTPFKKYTKEFGKELIQIDISKLKIAEDPKWEDKYVDMFEIGTTKAQNTFLRELKKAGYDSIRTNKGTPTETVIVFRDISPKEIIKEVVPTIKEVEISEVKKYLERLPHETWISGSLAVKGKITDTKDVDIIVEVSKKIYEEPMSSKLKDIENRIWEKYPQADVFFAKIGDRTELQQIPRFMKPGGIITDKTEGYKGIVSRLWKQATSTKIITPIKPVRITMRETTLLKERIRQYARGFREGRKFTKDQIKTIQTDVIKTIERSDLPLVERAKFIRTLKNIQTPEQLAKMEPEISKRLESAEARIEKREAVSSLRKTIKELDLKKMRPEFRKEIENVLEDLDVINTSDKKLSTLEKTKRFIRDNPEHIIPDYVFDQLKVLEQKQLRNLTTEEIRIVEATIGHAVKLNELKNKLIFGKRYRDAIRDIASAIEHVKTKPSKIKIDPNLITAEDVIRKANVVQRIFGVESYGMEDISEILDRTKIPYGLDDIVKEVITGEPTTRQIISEIMYRQIDKGTSKTLAFRHFVNDFIKQKSKDIVIDKEGDAWSLSLVKNKKDIGWQEVKLDDGRIIKLSRANRISIYLLSLRDKAMRHFLEKGFSFESTPTRVHKIDQNGIDTIVNSMSENEKKVATIIYEYFNTIAKNAINETSMKINGFPIANEDNYFPMTTNAIMRFRDHLKIQLTPETLKSFIHTTLEGMGIFKQVTPYTAPLIIEDVFKVLERHKMQVSSYIGLAEPLRNMKMLIYDSNFRSSVIERFGQHYWDSLKDYIYDMEVRIQDPTGVEKLTQSLINKMDPSILGANPWVIAKQPVSYLLANIEMNSKYLSKAVPGYNKRKTAEEMWKWSPQLRDRLEGNITREIGEIMGVGQIKKTWTGKDIISKKLMGGIRWSDMQAVGRIWNAVKLEVKGEHPELKGDDYWKVVAARTDHVVRKTQPTFLLKDRSRIGRSKNPFVRVITKYSTIRNRMYRLIITETHRYQMSGHTAKDKAKWIKNIGLITLISSLIMAGINETRRLFLRKKPSTITQFVFNTIGNTIGLSYFIGDVFSSLSSKITTGKFAGWDISNPVSSFIDNTVDAVAEFVRATDQIIKGETDKWGKTMLKAIDAALDSIGKFKGIPYKTIRDIIEGVIKWTIPQYDTESLPSVPLIPPKAPTFPKPMKLPMEKLKITQFPFSFKDIKNLLKFT